jgi:oxygen-independent coproporphyrinogen-3 oxidase
LDRSRRTAKADEPHVLDGREFPSLCPVRCRALAIPLIPIVRQWNYSPVFDALGDEDAELTLYALAIDTLEASGFEQYEISSFARPGRRCRHNQTYWANAAYFGFGMGAARYILGRRELNARDLQRYIRLCLSGESPTWQAEELPPEERARETMAVQLRRVEGIDRAAFRTQTGYDLDALAGAALTRHIEQGFLADDGASVRLTRRGKYVADTVIERLL